MKSREFGKHLSPQDDVNHVGNSFSKTSMLIHFIENIPINLFLGINNCYYVIKRTIMANSSAVTNEHASSDRLDYAKANM